MSPINCNSPICCKQCSVQDTVFILFLYNHWRTDDYHKMIYWGCLPYRFLVVFSYSRWFLNTKVYNQRKQLDFISDSQLLFLVSLKGISRKFTTKYVLIFSTLMWSLHNLHEQIPVLPKLKGNGKIHWNKNSLIVKSKQPSTLISVR